MLVDAAPVSREPIGDLDPVESLDEEREDPVRDPVEPAPDRVGELGDDQPFERVDRPLLCELELTRAPLVILALFVDPDRRKPLATLAAQARVGGDRRMLDDIGGVLLKVVEDGESIVVEAPVRGGALDDAGADLRADLLLLKTVLVERARTRSDIRRESFEESVAHARLRERLVEALRVDDARLGPAHRAVPPRAGEWAERSGDLDQSLFWQITSVTGIPGSDGSG